MSSSETSVPDDPSIAKRYRYVVQTTVSHTFYTLKPLSDAAAKNILANIEDAPTDCDGVLDGLDDLEDYDCACGIDTSFGTAEFVVDGEAADE